MECFLKRLPFVRSHAWGAEKLGHGGKVFLVMVVLVEDAIEGNVAFEEGVFDFGEPKDIDEGDVAAVEGVWVGLC